MSDHTLAPSGTITPSRKYVPLDVEVEEVNHESEVDELGNNNKMAWVFRVQLAALVIQFME